MTKSTRKFSKLVLRATTRILTIALVLVGFEVSSTFAQTRAYVANRFTVSVIDSATNTVVATVPIEGVGEIAITPDGAFAYLTMPNQTISVLDTATNTVVATVPIGLGALGIAITPDGAFAYVTNANDGTVSVIDTTTNTVIATVSVGRGASEVAITPNGAFAYVVNGIGHTVSVIDTATNTISATIAEVLPLKIAITPGIVYLTTFADTFSESISVTVIDTATNTIIATIPVGFGGGGIAITPNGAFAYVVLDPDLNVVSVIDIATRSVIATVSIATRFAPVGPFGIAITPDGAFAYVTNLRSDTVSVIDTTTNTVIATIPVGDRPTAIAFAPRVQTDPIGSLTAQVQALVAGGTLTVDQGMGLIDKLQQVQSKIDKGQTAAACNQVGSFINQVNALLNSSSLTTSQGQALINTANAIKTSLGC